MTTGAPAPGRPNSPWCVKGIDRTLRAAAKQAALQDGITLGAWLSRLIAAAAEAGAPPDRAAPTAKDAAALEAMVGDIRRLAGQIAAAEARSVAAVAPLSAQVAQMSGRLDALHPAGAGESRQVEQAMADISARLREVEKSIAAPHRQGVLFGRFDQPRG